MKEIGFQTKDFNCLLENYFILSDKYLYYSDINCTKLIQIKIDKKLSIFNTVYFTEDVCWEKDAESVFVKIDLEFIENKLSSINWVSQTEESIQQFDIYNNIR